VRRGRGPETIWLLVEAGETIEPAYLDAADSPLYEWLNERRSPPPPAPAD
jgi:hypothetical protein